MRSTRERAERVIETIVEGFGLKEALSKEGIGSTTFYRLVEKDFNLQTALARAEKIRADMLADETVKIADTDENPLRARNRIDSRKWLASVYNRTKYGDSIDLSVTNRVNLVDVIAEARKRAQVPGWSQDAIDSAQVVEVQAIEVSNPIGSTPTTNQKTSEDTADPLAMLD